MSAGFAQDWLDLREAADLGARNVATLAAAAAHLAGREAPLILDLGAGAGNNLRALAPHLGPGQRWVLVDSDAALLGLAAARAPEGVEVATRVADLGQGLDALLDPAPDLVTASAFFDLAGAAWIDAAAASLGRAGVAVLAVLTHDGREDWAPPHAADGAVLDAFHADQRRDKGLGLALGPDAHRRLAGALEANGLEVTEGASDWVLAAGPDAPLIAALAEGHAEAVRPRLGDLADDWARDRRRAARVTIGHMDLFARP